VWLQAEGCLTAPCDAPTASVANPSSPIDATATAKGQRQEAVSIGVGLEAVYESSQLASPSCNTDIVDALLR
jgi:hypothetical protein